MSLDVYLYADEPVTTARCSGIFIRWNGETREVSRATWDELNPGVEPVTVVHGDEETTCVYHRNITHNLTTMADACGVYHACWRPDEIGVTHARQLIQPLTDGLHKLRADPDRYKVYNPPNGWGDYDGLVRFVADYLAACERNPDARVEACR